MTPLISARRAAEDFARVVDGSQADVADRYSDLTAYVDLLRAQDTPEARPEFVTDLRMQLMAAADTLLVPAERELAAVLTLPRTSRKRERRLAVAAAAFVVIGGTAGVAAAAESALPGQPLYPVKRAIESAQISLNSSDAAKGNDLIDQASTRLSEIDGLMNDGKPADQITRTLTSFKSSVRNGADLLFVSYQRDGDTQNLAKLRSTLVKQTAKLHDLSRQAPSTSRPDFASATALLGDLDQQARVLCGGCGPATGAGDFSVSSTPFSSLLTEPAAAASADQFRSQQQSLAEKAAQIAATMPKPAAPGTATSTGVGGTATPGTGSTLPSASTAVKGTVTTVAGGVQNLLTDVSTSTGGVLSPVTDALNGTLDSVTGLLTGP